MAGGFQVATAYVRILPSLLGFGALLARRLTGQQSVAVSGAKKVGMYMGGALLAGLALTFGKGIAGEIAHQKIAAQTAAVLESTGGAANVSASHVEDLAIKLRKLSGVDEDVIQANENMLLTFTNVKNSVGEGNDIFDQATKTVLDMSVALNQDGKASAIQLGKALNDPIKGVTALQRVGVQFTKAQRKQIESMVESGDTLGAQKMILEELNKEFGGSAEAAGKTLPGQLNKAKLAYASLSEKLSAALLPALTTVAEKFAGFVEFLERHPNLFRALIIGAGILATAMIAYSTATAIATAANVLFGVSIAAVALPVFIVIGAIALLAVGFILAWKKSETFRNIVTGAFEKIKAVVTTVVNFIRDHWKKIITKLPAVFIISAILGKFSMIKNAGKAAFEAVRDAIQWVIDKIRTAIDAGSDLIGKLDSIRDKLPTPGNIAGGIADRFRQHGGPVSAGRGYIVGEAGPELFVAGRSGRIVPNDMLAAGAGGRVALTITNWQNGEGYMRSIAAGEVSGARRHDRQVERMER